jgi:hypothetical protein
MNDHWIYAHNYNGTVHLVPFYPDGEPTLCGRSALTMREGDETTSGVAATCNACRKAAGRPAQPKEDS